jgi:predicted Zn-dependent protease with MMP-like domain
MKNYKLLFTLLLLFAFACSPDEDSMTENGTNPTPNLQATGSSADDFLSGSKYSRLAIELVYVEGFHPNAQTITNLRNFLEARLNKPGGITITEREISTTGQAPYTITEVAALETENRTLYNTPDTLAFYLFFCEGGNANDTGNSFILGTAYRNTSCVIYENSVQNLSNSINEPNRVVLETTVVLHEVGHLLGLVDFGSPMQTPHEDASHLHHCSHSNCLMYWTVESSSAMANMIGIPELDANCLADLAANGGK